MRRAVLNETARFADFDLRLKLSLGVLRTLFDIVNNVKYRVIS